MLLLDALSSVAYGPEVSVLVMVGAELGLGRIPLLRRRTATSLATVLRARTDVVVCMLPYRLKL
ncbi:hypothetical protein OG607_40910 [Streptomyces sp. NBC_01537]|uniref:hypothetical protein n=1 Tax=Streptomyces sp. NBC_01537 TaxID=2903896 RepID=UPI00386791A1